MADKLPVKKKTRKKHKTRTDKIIIPDAEIQKIETMAAVGCNIVQIGAILGVSKATFERRMRENPKIADAVEKGRAAASLQVKKKAFEMAISGEVPAMTMFWLKCRAKWSEVQKVEHSGPDGSPIELKNANMTDPEIDARIKKLISE